MNPIFKDVGILQPTQTAYRRNSVCADSIFAGQKSNFKSTVEGDRMYTYFYDLASTFDSVEFSVLLEQL